VRPLGPGERIDLDRATAVEIARLPRVGLALARAIVVDREAHGPFGSLPALDRVPGIGPGLVTAIETHVTFSGNLSASPAPPAPSALDLNTAGAADLERLPFIGTYMARQIVAYRDKHGAFPSVDSLVRVPGIGPATLAKVRDRLRVEQ
jgi:competence protein ComEA